MPTTSTPHRPHGSRARNGSPSAVLIVDDHPLLRDGLRRLLSGDPGLSVRGEAGSIAEARRLYEELRPDLVVLDFDLPDGDSLTFVEELRSLPDPPTVIVLCGRDDPSRSDAAAIRNGASAFLSKRTDGDEVLRVVREALGGKTYLSPDMIARLLRRPGR